MICNQWKFVTTAIFVPVLFVSTSLAERTWMDGEALTYTEGAINMPYRLYLPADYQADQEYPLVLYLHGSGQRGNDNESQVMYTISGLIDRTESDYPAILVVPQLPTGDSWINRSRNDLTVGILNSLQQDYSVDEDRLYVTGHSNGGFGATQYIHDLPDMFAAAATLSGAWVPPNHREPLTGFPIWLFHGAWDGTVDKSWSENYYRSVTGESGRIVFDETVLGYPTAISEPVRYSQIPQRAHRIGDEVYANEDTGLYDWMFAQSRASEVLIGDFDGNNVLDVGDVDSLSRQIASGTNDSAHDLTQDGLVNRSDLAFWVKDLKNTWIGDANLDGEFNSSDLVSIFQVGEYEDDLQLNSNWTEGDWDADGEFTTSDLVAAFQDGGFERGPRAAFHVVPEPSAIPVLAIAMFVFPGRGRLSTHQFSVASEVL